ncbi:MAG: hypothetical protein WCF81_21460 [Roseiarcus sp.]
MSVSSDAPIGVQELAGVLGVTRRTVSDLVRRGVLRKRGRGFVLGEAVQDYVRSIAARAATTPGLETGAEARARLARMKADLFEQQHKREAGDLVSAKEVWAIWDKRMAVYWREVRQIPWIIAGTLGGFIDREKAMLLGRELWRCHSNLGKHRGPDEDGEGTDYDVVVEDAFIKDQGRLSTEDGERIAAEARARRGLPPRAEEGRQ